MLAAGLVDEVRRVLAAGAPASGPGLDGVGYREVVAMVEGRLAERDLREAIFVATRRYAKRQETWFRNQLRRPSSPVWTLDASEDPEILARKIHDRWMTVRGDD